MTTSLPHPQTVPTHTGGQPHGSGHHRSSSSVTSLAQFGIGVPPVPPGSGPSVTQGGAPGSTPGAAPLGGPSSGPNQTRILLLSNFSPSLKTKDLQDLVADWQDDHGGLKVKWRDDTSAWVVFADPTVAKRAFLSLVSNPPPAIHPSATHTYAPCITPYTGPDVPQILQAVQNRPRSRSIAGQGATSGHGHGGHARRGSGVGGSGGGAALAAMGIGAGGAQGQGQGQPQQQYPHGSPAAAPAGMGHAGGGGGGGHNRTASWTRQSIDRRTREANLAASAAAPALDLDLTSPVDDTPPERPAHARRPSSPETPGGPGGIVAGEAPRRFGNHAAVGGGAAQGAPGVNGHGHGHRRSESRSGSDQVGIAVAGLTISE